MPPALRRIIQPLETQETPMTATFHWAITGTVLRASLDPDRLRREGQIAGPFHESDVEGEDAFRAQDNFVAVVNSYRLLGTLSFSTITIY